MAAKIKDGLFIGDAETSQSEVFINDNKISNLINLSGREVQNIWSSHGLVYLTYYWEDRIDYKLFINHEDTMLMDLVEFIDVSINHGISVLLFSRRGTGRCVIAACLYLMMKYRWGFEKTYDYVYSKKPDIDLNKGFIQQMFALDMKLLAARQKAFALLEGVDTGFKIEANMTISDIASMLPPREAKRWNAWDTDYLFGDSKGSTDENDSKMVSGDFKHDKRHSSDIQKNGYSGKGPGSQSKEDVEEELVLIYSFVNSKNTINSLPGPYRTAYEVPKHFKLRFDSVRLCQEEDVHMFPTSPPSNSRYSFAPRGILKGGHNHAGKFEKDKIAQPKNLNKQSESHRGAKEARQSEMTAAQQSHSTSNNSLLDSIAPMHVINSARQLNGGVERAQLHDHSTLGAHHDTRHSRHPPGGADGWAMDSQSSDAKASSSSSGSTQKQPRLNDLYGFVGMASSIDGGKDGAFHSRAETKHDSNHHQQHDTTNTRVSGASVPLSAEERLRNLMADMQRQNYGVSASTAPHSGATTASTSGGKSRSGDQNVRESTIPSMDFSASNPLRQQSHQQQNTPSLYDLANMHFGGSSGQRSTKHSQDASGRSANVADGGGGARSSSSREYGQYLSAPLPVDEDADPLSAFDLPSNTALSSSRGSGAVRARHDIVPNQQQSYLNNGRGAVAYPPPPRVQQGAVKTAWSDSPSSQQQSNSRGALSSGRNTSNSAPSGSSSRHPSPSLRQQQQGSSISVTSIHSGQASINPQINPQHQPQSTVGSGTSSGSRVYRHGSPAPNAVRSSRSAVPPVGSSGAGYGGGSVGSAGTLGSGGPGPSTGSAHRGNLGSSAPPARYSTSSGSRPASPMSARGSTPMTTNPRDQQSGTPQRRLSSNSVHTLNSDNANAQQSLGQSISQPDRRRSGSPLLVRSSQNSGPVGTGGSGGGTAGKRFSTPTPQSSQHHDYELAGGAARGAVRSGTPTKSSWKF